MVKYNFHPILESLHLGPGLEVDYESIFEFSQSEFGNYDVNSLILLTMHLTLEKIVQEVENEKPEIAQELRD